MQMCTPLIALFALAASPTLASAAAPHSARDCPALFGASPQQEENESVRQERLLSVETVKDSVVVSHAYARWNAPSVLKVKDVELVAIEPAHDDQPAALTLRVGEENAGACEAGLYSIRVDDSIGNDGQVLATTAEAALIQHQDALFAWVPEGKKPPSNWRMVWRADYEITIEKRSAAKSSSSKSAAQRRKDRAKKNRNKKKKKKSSRKKSKGRKR